MPSVHVSHLLLFLLFSFVERSVCKSVAENGALEVQVRVQVFDGGDLSPLSKAAIVVHGNQSTLASRQAENDEAVVVNFLYRTGTWVIITASHKDYVTSSVPWHANRVPLYASVSLYLLAQRPGTLILYDDVIQVFHGSPGGRSQPWLHIPRRSLQLNTSFSEITAVLTTARDMSEINAFPYLVALELNTTGGENRWTDLTAVAAVSAQLFDRDGHVVQVTESIHVSVPLPSDSRVRSPTSIPVWVYNTKTGLWLRNGTGYIKRDGTHLTLDFMASRLGYWIAAFPSTSGPGLSHPSLRDITAYHTLFLLSILGSLALLVLVLLCVLLYYCRRRCLKPRRQQKQVQASSALCGSKRDQGTSTSRLNLICGGHVEPAASNGDLDASKSDTSPSREYKSAREELSKHVPAHKLRHSSKNKQSKGAQRGGESFPMKVHRSTETSSLDSTLLRDDYGRNFSPDDKDHDYRRRHVVNDNRGYTADPPSPPIPDKPPEYSQVSQGPDLLARPTSLNTQPGQIIFCSSLDQMTENMYRSMVPTLVIPAHYMRLSSEFNASEAKDSQGQAERESQGGAGNGVCSGIQNQGQSQGSGQMQAQPGVGSPGGSDENMWASGGPSAPVHIPVLFNDSTMAQMNGELQALTEKKLRELGVKQHPRAWFISLDGRANAHVRHSYIDVGSELGHSGANSSNHSAQSTLSAPAGTSKDCSPDTSLQDTPHERKQASGRKSKEERHGSGRKGHGGNSSSSGKQYSKLPYHDPLDLSSGVGRMGAGSPLENPLTPLLDDGPEEPRGSTMPRRGRSRGNSSRSSNSETQRDSVTSPEDENDPDDKDENKKSPWQRIEERPLMVFHAKK
ncbi:protein FAM171A2 [Pygocentrus nattereri]|uniref:Family with sequence similarity 171 member A2b n=1 Tax=Pygocentrus nattereri TaxID=42514 RepID=A0A3B4CCI0_PYGNA|nr:protein FAM171A2 [Pygocentrus nattereri]